MPRRGKREGSIYRRRDGRWAASVQVGYKPAVDSQGHPRLDSHGRPKVQRLRQTFYGRTREEVARRLSKAVAAQGEGLPVLSERQTVGQYLERWLENLAVERSVRERTRESYAQLVQHHIAPALGHHQLTRLEPQHIRALLGAKLDSGLAPRSVQYIHAVLRRALGQAFKDQLVARNVATVVTPPKVDREEIRPLDAKEARRLLEAAAGDRLEALYTVAVAIGLRQGEALGLRWQDLDLEERTLSVRQSVQRVGGELRFVEPKTRRSRRTVDLPSFAVEALRKHRARQREERLVLGLGAATDEDLVFIGFRGQPLSGAWVTRSFKALLKRAGIRGGQLRFHDLRHSAASLLFEQGVEPKVIQEILGHSDIGTTLNIYSHVFRETRRAAAAAMDRSIGNGS